MGAKKALKKIRLYDKRIWKWNRRKKCKKIKKGNLNNEIPDIPKKVIKIKKINGIRFCKIKWKKRRNNNYPKPSYVKYDIIKDRYPALLLEYIENHIHYEESPDIKININENRNDVIKNGKNKN